MYIYMYIHIYIYIHTHLSMYIYKSGEQFWSEVAINCNSDSFSFNTLHELAFGKSSRFSVLVSKLMSRNYKINRRNISELKDQIREPLEKSMILQGDSSGSLKLSADISITAAASTWFDRTLWSHSTILDTAMSIKLQVGLLTIYRNMRTGI
jgi:hypothetical protein